MEHYWAREFQKLGHEVRLISPQFVKPYVKSSKNDRNDSEGIAEAVTRPSMRFVAIKSIEQQDVLLVHRARDLIMKQRTAQAVRSQVTLVHKILYLLMSDFRPAKDEGIANRSQCRRITNGFGNRHLL